MLIWLHAMVAMATPVWHHDRVDPEPEMEELDEAVADLRREPERLARVAAALYQASKKRRTSRPGSIFFNLFPRYLQIN